MEDKKIDIKIESAKGYYIFMLDRSGSMSGRRIEQAKNAFFSLKVYLRTVFSTFSAFVPISKRCSINQ